MTALAALLAQALSRVAAEERLRDLAYHDELTELFNRRALLDHLGQRLARLRAAGPWLGEFDLPDFRLGVNKSPAELITIDLVTDIAAALETSAVPAANLTV